MKKVNLKQILKHNPCKDRIDNYIKHYGDKSYTIKEFLSMEHITFRDKVWVAFRLMPKKNIRFAAGYIAKTVLCIYEEKYPNDERPRNAIKEATRIKLNKKAAAANAAYAAAYAADADAAYAAAYAADAAYAAYAYAVAVDAAANAANAAANAAAYAVAYAVAVDAADAAAYAAAYAVAVDAADADADIEKKQLKILQKYWENKK